MWAEAKCDGQTNKQTNKQGLLYIDLHVSHTVGRQVEMGSSCLIQMFVLDVASVLCQSLSKVSLYYYLNLFYILFKY